MPAPIPTVEHVVIPNAPYPAAITSEPIYQTPIYPVSVPTVEHVVVPDVPAHPSLSVVETPLATPAIDAPYPAALPFTTHYGDPVVPISAF